MRSAAGLLLPGGEKGRIEAGRNPILPCKGRWHAQRDGGVSPLGRSASFERGYPSTALRAVPLPLRGRIG